jgi:hypothetical protein
MLFLVLDIGFHLTHLRMAYGKRPVALLPIEIMEIGEGIVDPNGRVSLDAPDQIRDGFVRPPADEKMDVILRTADTVEGAFLVANGPAEIRVDPRKYLSSEGRR